MRSKQNRNSSQFKALQNLKFYRKLQRSASIEGTKPSIAIIRRTPGLMTSLGFKKRLQLLRSKASWTWKESQIIWFWKNLTYRQKKNSTKMSLIHFGKIALRALVSKVRLKIPGSWTCMRSTRKSSIRRGIMRNIPASKIIKKITQPWIWLFTEGTIASTKNFWKI